MQDRREVALGGLLSLAFGVCGCACGAHAEEELQEGCMLEDEQDSILFAGVGAPQPVLAKDQRMVRSSGDTDLDFAIGRTVQRLSGLFKVSAGFAYFEGAKENNAWATTRKLKSGTDGSVLLGIKYLKAKLKAKEAPDAWVAATLAHEFGHVLAYKNNLAKALPRTPNSKRFELHADFMAGYYAGLSKKRDPEFPAVVFVTSRYAVGSYQTQSKTFHGTPDERAKATIRGFETSYREGVGLGAAIQNGVRFVKTL